MIYGNGDIYDEEFKNKIIGMKKENWHGQKMDHKQNKK
jgi:hypothetical protein